MEIMALLERLLCVWGGQEPERHQPVKDRRESQTEGSAQKGICDAQDHSALEPLDPCPQHQRAQAVHCRLIPVIRAKAQA